MTQPSQPSQSFSLSDVSHIADLANIPITEHEQKSLQEDFNKTLSVISVLQKVSTSVSRQTYQVTGLQSVVRDDVVDHDRMFSQEEALRNAKRKHNGYFVVNQVLDK